MKKAVRLARLIHKTSLSDLTWREKQSQNQLAKMMEDPIGKAFSFCLTDQCFRSHSNWRTADQIAYLVQRLGIPSFASMFKKLGLGIFCYLKPSLSQLSIPFTRKMIKQEMNHVILPGESGPLRSHLMKRRGQNIRVILNNLGEAVLGEEEAHSRLQLYLEALERPEVEYLSIKLSTIYSQINLLAWEKNITVLSARLRQLFRACKDNLYVHSNGERFPKFVNLDMEEYKDLHLTVEVFRAVLDEEEFLRLPAGLVLQAYLPDSFQIQQELTSWAQRRIESGGAPIKIRLVKGANLAMERVEASQRLWEQAPYLSKAEVDANYKRMLDYAMDPSRASAVHLGVGSHNIFDIAYALILMSERGVEPYISFEMLEGMSDHVWRIVRNLTNEMLLYCPVASEENYHNAIAYLVRRLDENTSPENFLRHAFGSSHDEASWKEQEERFLDACLKKNEASVGSRRDQNRNDKTVEGERLGLPFQNEADTDWALASNREWIKEVQEKWQRIDKQSIPLVIGGKRIHNKDTSREGRDPSRPKHEVYDVTEAGLEHVEEILCTAVDKQNQWASTPPLERSSIMSKLAQILRERRGDLIGAMILDGGKTAIEADVEISEAIDFAEYYRRNLMDWYSHNDLSWSPKGCIMVCPPWNFPCAIPLGGVIAALLTGNTVIFKPAQETVLVAWEVVKAIWDAGVSQSVLQFVPCPDDPVASRLVSDSRVNGVILTGATETAKKLLDMRSDLNLWAETGGKNALIVSRMSDRDLAIRDLVYSAFGHGGQKCSAASLGILEAELYDDPSFLKQIKDAAQSLTCGSAWDFSTKIPPLIQQPGECLRNGLTRLDRGESWLLEPYPHPDNPRIWSPGIKLGVQAGSFSHQNEFFGPVLSLMRAKDLNHAIQIANNTPYGLTSGLHSLDLREQELWKSRIRAGNLYINRGITGAVVRRQPFGGFKESSFGLGMKAGGPNYLQQFMDVVEIKAPGGKGVISEIVQKFLAVLRQSPLNFDEELAIRAAAESYAFWWEELKKEDDPMQVLGQDNILVHIPRDLITLRYEGEGLFLPWALVCIACLTCGCSLELSIPPKSLEFISEEMRKHFKNKIFFRAEGTRALEDRLAAGDIERLRILSPPSERFLKAAAKSACYIDSAPVVSNGRLELLHYVREVSICVDYHRYGDLSVRELEMKQRQ